MATTRKIIEGPSKFDFMNALFDGKEVEFKFEGFGKQPVNVQGVSLEDGSRERWLFQFRIARIEQSSLCKGYYDTRTRTGWVHSSGSAEGQGVLPDSGLRAIIDQLAGK